MLENISDKNIILASQSPRRQQLLKGLDIDFEIRVKPVDEVYPSHLPHDEVPVYLSRLKATAFEGELNREDVLITSDTVVLLEGKILEKPKDAEDAKRMVGMLSGKTHTVVTGVCITHAGEEITFSDETQVQFHTLSTEEIDYYVEHYKPFDKAGAYGVQEWIGYIGIDKMVGSYFTVMGFPLHLVYRALKSL